MLHLEVFECRNCSRIVVHGYGKSVNVYVEGASEEAPLIRCTPATRSRGEDVSMAAASVIATARDVRVLSHVGTCASCVWELHDHGERYDSENLSDDRSDVAGSADRNEPGRHAPPDGVLRPEDDSSAD